MRVAAEVAAEAGEQHGPTSVEAALVDVDSVPEWNRSRSPNVEVRFTP